MSKLKVGIDIESVGRFKKLPYKSNLSFYKKIFTDREIEYCLSKSDPYQHFAGKFAAKEAVSKALNQSVYKAKGIEILNDKAGAPIVRFKIQDSRFKIQVLLSISHTKDYAISVAIVF